MPVEFTSIDSTMQQELLELSHSFGYDCKRRGNLHLLDKDMLGFVAGNILVLLEMKTKQQHYIPSSRGGGIGAVMPHPSRSCFAVAEKGNQPDIIIYKYPSLQLYRKLGGGTGNMYSCINFNHDGTLLASVGGAPDYMLTVWDWNQEQVVLRCKAFSQDIYRVTFSPDNPGQLTTSGSGHIKFWKMANTFTGLKLQGMLGRFGKTPLTDIEGYIELPDGKVVSGSEWGNMLLWDGGLIKVEIGRKGGHTCHTGPIQQFALDEGELITVGTDGVIRSWDFETIDTADCTDDSGLFEIEPMNELNVGRNVSLSSMVRSIDAASTIWFAQDSNGGIWKLDLSFCNTTMEPELLFSFHAGAIEGMDVSGFSHLMATTALDGSVRIYDFLSNTELTVSQHRQGGSSLTWVPRMSVLAVGFEDGVLRLLELCKFQNEYVGAGGSVTQLRLKQAFKPHNASVTAISYNHDGKIMATGSLDGTVFFFSVGDTYEPIGFVKVPAAVQALQWAPQSHERNALLVMCQMDHVVEVEAPDTQDPGNTYHLQNLPIRHFCFCSIKSRIKREEELSRRQALNEMRKNSESHQEQDITEEEDLPPIFIPSSPCPLHCAFYSTEPGTFWLSVGGYDSGYLYHCKFSEEQSADPSDRRDEPFAYVLVQDADHNPILTVCFCVERRLLLCGMQDGSIRVYPLESDDLQPVHMQAYWVLSVHDSQYGRLRQLHVSHDSRFVLSTGADGNIFSFRLTGSNTEEAPPERFSHVRTSLPLSLDKNSVPLDIDSPDAYSIEITKQKQELDRMHREAEARKLERRQMIAKLRSSYQALLKRNESLPEHVRLQPSDLMLDCRFRKEIKRQMAENLKEVKKELAWETEKWNIALKKIQERFVDPLVCDTVVVYAIQHDLQVSTYKLRALPKNRYQMKEEDETEPQSESSTVQQDRHTKQEDSPPTDDEADHAIAGEELQPQVLQGAGSNLAARRAVELHKTAEKLEKARAAIEQRKRAWDELYASKPSKDCEDPEDIHVIQVAQENMGEFKLKTAKDFKVSPQQRMNRAKKTEQMIRLEDQIFEMKNQMNMRVLALRDSKVALMSQFRSYMKQLRSVQKLLPPEKHRTPPIMPTLTPQETPEKELQVSLPKLERCAAALAQTGFASWDDKFNRLHEMMQQDTDEETCEEEETADSEEEETTDTEEKITELEKEVMEMEEIRNLYQQDTLIKQMEEAVCLFDAQLHLLRHDKLQLDPRVKLAELRCITLFQELLLIQEYEDQERALEQTLHARVQEERDIQVMMEECKCRLEVRTRDMVKLQERKKDLLDTLKTSLGENNKFADFLTKVFKKKIKRVKAQETLGREEHSDEHSDESDWDSDEDDDDEVESDDSSCYDYSVCPEGCNPQLYEQIISLREQRLDIEEFLKEHEKTVENLKREYDIITKKAKVLQANKKRAEDNLDLLIREKQHKVNDLDVVVPLRLHQIEYENREMPTDLSVALVINSACLSRLDKRIKELHQENSAQKELYRQARQHHVQLRNELRDLHAKSQELQAQCDQMMIDKFGKLVDLDALQTLSSSQKVQEKKNEKEVREAHNREMLNMWQRKVADAEKELAKVNREHAARLRHFSSLKNEKKHLEDQLNARQNMHSWRPRETDEEDIQRLKLHTQKQAENIKCLNQEITALCHKDVPVLPPVVPRPASKD